MVLPPLAQALVEPSAGARTYLALGVGVLVIGLPNVLALVRERPHDGSGRSSATTGASVRTAVTTYPFWLLVVVLFVSSIAQNGALAHLPALLSDRGVGPSGAAAALSAMGAASLLGRLTTGWFLDRYWAAYVSCALLTMAAGGVPAAGLGALVRAGRTGGGPDRLRHGRREQTSPRTCWRGTSGCDRSPRCTAGPGRPTRAPARSVRSSWAAPSMHKGPTRAF